MVGYLLSELKGLPKWADFVCDFLFFSHRDKHPKFQFDSVKIEVRATI